MATVSVAADSRISRGRQLWEERSCEFEHVGDHVWLVPSSDGERSYRVSYGGLVEERCSCDDFYFHGHIEPCKHIYSVAIAHAKKRRGVA